MALKEDLMNQNIELLRQNENIRINNPKKYLTDKTYLANQDMILHNIDRFVDEYSLSTDTLEQKQNRAKEFDNEVLNNYLSSYPTKSRKANELIMDYDFGAKLNWWDRNVLGNALLQDMYLLLDEEDKLLKRRRFNNDNALDNFYERTKDQWDTNMNFLNKIWYKKSDVSNRYNHRKKQVYNPKNLKPNTKYSVQSPAKPNQETLNRREVLNMIKNNRISF